MSKQRFRKYLDDGLIVLLIMAGAVVAAALEVGAVLGGLPGSSLSAFAPARRAASEPARTVAPAPAPVAAVSLARVED